MANYQESSVTGTRWQRASAIHISHPRHGPITLTYVEERVTQLGANAVHEPVGQLTNPVSLEDSIPLRDPDTLALTGEALPVAVVYQALFSDYLNRALARDSLPDTDPGAP